MIRQWNLGACCTKSSTFKPTPGDFHIFICSLNTNKKYLDLLMETHKIPKENLIYESVACENDVHPGSSRNTVYIIKT